MDIISSSFDGSLSRYWRRRRYQRIDNFDRKNMKTVRFGRSKKRFWRIKAIPRLRFKIIAYSPLRLWIKFKNAYVNMMLRLADNQSVFGVKRIPKERQVSGGNYSNDEFHNRLVYEIYKSLMASRELSTT